MLYSLDEICLTPASVSSIEHRKDVIIYNNHNKLPLFSAPMACVIDNESASKFEQAGINTIMPRNINWEDRYLALVDGLWVAVGFNEAQYILDECDFKETPKIHLCIDQANGHMQTLLELCKRLKNKFGDKIRIMTGNIANPKAYAEYAYAGVDYIRCGIGGGSACTTSVQTGMHYPMGSLIIECNKERNKLKQDIEYGARPLTVPKIVADGGFKRIDQCVKALALGADYVMLGEVLAKSREACGKTFFMDNDGCKFDAEIYHETHREYFGMSTEKAQLLVNDASKFRVDGYIPKHSEGQVRYVPIEYSIKDWVADFEHALRSSMSYAGTKRLYGEDGYVGNVEYDYMTPVTYNAYMK
jgi:IMP dehydrogenase/GMP reductase